MLQSILAEGLCDASASLGQENIITSFCRWFPGNEC